MFGGSSGGGYDAPKLSAISVQSIGYGSTIQILWGTDRVSPILGWTGNFKRVEHHQGGGKGFGGGGGGVTYTYYADVLFLLTEGAVRGFGRMWRDKNKANSIDKFFSFTRPGEEGQSIWPNLTTNFPDQALGYSGISLIAASGYQLTDSATLGNHSIEVFGLKTVSDIGAQNNLDAHIKDVIEDFISNPRFGAISQQSAEITLDTAHMHEYCKSRNLLISPLLNSTRPAHDYLTDWAKIANAGVVWSEGILKFRPLSDLPYHSSFGDYTPDTSISYHFDADDGAVYELIKPTRKKPQDCYNKVTVEYLNRGNEYNNDSVIKDDLAAIDDEGVRPAQPLKLDCIKVRHVATVVALTELQALAYRRIQYEIVTDCDADVLEPVDFVTVSCLGLGLDYRRCRIISCEDSQNAILKFIVEDAPIGGYCG